ncbi:MAG: diguanylate cyclase [Syntrophales bacterium]|nr:diguanylate cyclase [Syntrophales bacterium]
MKKQSERGLKYRFLIIGSLTFVLPFLIIAYLFYKDGIIFRLPQVLVFSLVLLLILSGFIILRRTFEDIFSFANVLKTSAETGNYKVLAGKSDLEELDEITNSFRGLVKKLDRSNRESNKRILELKTIGEVIELASKTLKIDELLDIVLEKAMVLSRAHSGAVFSVSEDDFTLIRAFGTDAHGKQAFLDRCRILSRAACEKKDAVYKETESVNKDEVCTPDESILLAIPIIVDNVAVGVLNLEYTDEKNGYTGDDEEILSIMIGEIGFAIKNALLYSKVEKHLREAKEQNQRLEMEIAERRRAEEALMTANQKIERLHSAAHRMQTLSLQNDVFDITIGVAEEVFATPFCVIYIADDGYLVPKAMSKQMKSVSVEAVSPKEENLAAKTYRIQKTYWLDGENCGPEETGFTSLMSAPIGDHGVFQMFSKQNGVFTDNDSKLLGLLLRHAAEALKRIALQDELQKEAIHDPLTGAYNRRYFDQVIDSELKRSLRYGHSVGFLMIDVNRFKFINDDLGHQMGDYVLQEIAKLLQGQIRDVDILIRYGGDEFLIILPETGDGIPIIVERIRKAVKLWNEEKGLFDFEVTLAIGAAFWDPAREMKLSEVLSEADQRMYEDKKSQSTQRK